MQLLSLLDELRAIGRTGLNFADNPYDEERYERILELVSQYYGKTVGVPSEEIREDMAAEMGQVTPKVGVDAILFDEEGQILLMKRPESGLWCLPGGAMEIHESPEEAVVREAHEETGLSIRPETLLGAYRLEPNSVHPYTTILLPYLCTVTDGTLQLSHEGEALQYWEVEEVPDWFPKHEEIALEARKQRDDD
ncbi:NUDIX hydrolase N-terminal domain-containing protein [Halolamina salina]|uniref:NUDIX hydrolase N-terminal domain-containing protein n=1 Tax=Halolamina salina TaxID=1220023 RepID=A0ABD6BAT7_9EURY